MALIHVYLSLQKKENAKGINDVYYNSKVFCGAHQYYGRDIILVNFLHCTNAF